MPLPVQMMSGDNYSYGPWDHESHSGEIFVPSSGWKDDDVLANIRSQVNMKQRSWNVRKNFLYTFKSNELIYFCSDSLSPTI